MWCDEHIGKRLEDLEVAVPGVHALMQLHLPQVREEQRSCKHAAYQHYFAKYDKTGVICLAAGEMKGYDIC